VVSSSKAFRLRRARRIRARIRARTRNTGGSRPGGCGAARPAFPPVPRVKRLRIPTTAAFGSTGICDLRGPAVVMAASAFPAVCLQGAPQSPIPFRNFLNTPHFGLQNANVSNMVSNPDEPGWRQQNYLNPKPLARLRQAQVLEGCSCFSTGASLQCLWIPDPDTIAERGRVIS